MEAPLLLRDVLAEGSTVRLVADGIWSTDAEATSHQVYDRHAALYDWLIGNKLYNRLAWGTSPASYARFAEQAVRFGHGPLLDGGCGSLVSTAELHIRSARPTILCDLSLGMLEAARKRVMDIAGTMPEHLVFVQADLRQLPFKDGAFGSILCPGMLHIFDDVEIVTAELARVASGYARLFMSSLVAERWLGKRDLGALHRAGEVATPRSSIQLLHRLEMPSAGLEASPGRVLEGSMLFITAEPRRPRGR